MRYALACLLLTAACTSADAGTFRPAGPASVPPPPRPAAHAGLEILKAYREFHRVFETAIATNDPSELSWVAATPLARRLGRMIRAQHRERIIRRGHSALDPRLVRHGDDTAVVHDCIATSGLTTFNALTGRRTKRPTPERALLAVTLRRDFGWKVARIARTGAC